MTYCNVYEDVPIYLGDTKICDEYILNRMTKVLLELGLKLNYGDIIKIEDNPFIFNGKKVCNISYDIDYKGHLPKEFKVIENMIPINYWSLVMGNIVWFNHHLVLGQCLNEIKIENGKCFTAFSFNTKTYYIIFEPSSVGEMEDYDNISNESIINSFKEILLYNKDIPFLISHYDNVLYIKYDFLEQYLFEQDLNSSDIIKDINNFHI